MRRFWLATIVLGLAAIGTWSSWGGNDESPPTLASVATTPEASARHVETISPRQGGLSRELTLPCSAHAFEGADLFARASGFLRQLHVDLGSHVRKGDVLAEIDAPERVQELNAARVAEQQAEAGVAQAQAGVQSAQAEYEAAKALIDKAETDVERWTAEAAFREKQYRRFEELSRSESIQASVVDEELLRLKSAQAAQRSAVNDVQSARKEAGAAAARVDLARAEQGVAEARREAARTDVKQAEIMVSFTQIVSPYDGVVTRRNLHRGDFVRSADAGGMALLRVERSDLLRVVANVPDRDVPFAQPGDAVVINFDALPERTLTGKIERIALVQDPDSRTMRVEVDLPNTEGIIVGHMYGSMTIVLEPAHTDCLTVPSNCLVGDARGGEARVFVVKDEVCHECRVSIGRDTGSQVEVLEGISASDAVIVRPPGSLIDGAAVVAAPAPAG